MSRVSVELKLSLVQKVLLGALVAGIMLPITAFAQDSSGAERPTNPYKLPFLHDATSGGVETTTHQGLPGDGNSNGGTSGTSGSGTNNGGGSGSVAVAPGGLISQANHCRFKDIQGTSSEVAINYLYDKGVAGGRSPCYFDPNATATRAEAATMVVRAVNAPVPTTPLPKAFPDTDVKAWSAKTVKAAKNADIVHGYPDSLYRAEKPVNVVESLKIVTRGFKSNFSGWNTQQLKKINDIELNQWYVQYVQAGLNEGIIDSDTTQLYPATQVTRAELAEMVYRMMMNRAVAPPEDIPQGS